MQERDLDSIGRRAALVEVLCTYTGRRYEARMHDFNRRHGWTCVACGRDLPWDTPTRHLIERVRP